MLRLEAYSDITTNSVVGINSYSDFRWVPSAKCSCFLCQQHH